MIMARLMEFEQTMEVNQQIEMEAREELEPRAEVLGKMNEFAGKQQAAPDPILHWRGPTH